MAAPNRSSRHNWTAIEDSTLVQALVHLVQEGGWRADNGTFRSKYHNELLRLMHEKIPGCSITSTTVIDGRVKSLKRQYQAIAEMLGTGSGFGWNDVYKCIQVEQSVFDTWVQTHPNAKGLNNKAFPHYDDLAYVFGKERASGFISGSAADVVEEEINTSQYEGGCSQEYYRPEPPVAEEEGTNTPTSRQSTRPGPSSVGEKRKRPTPQQEMVDVMRVGMDMQFQQIQKIADWPVTTQRIANEDADAKRDKVAEILGQVTPPLTNEEQIVLMNILFNDLTAAASFIRVPDDKKRSYCEFLLSRFH